MRWVVCASVAPIFVFVWTPVHRLHTLCRLYRPFPELKRFALSFNLEELDELTYHHLPYGELVEVWMWFEVWDGCDHPGYLRSWMSSPMPRGDVVEV